MMDAIICVLLGYLIGSINPAYFWSRIKGFDIRDRGSGNAGASNAFVMLGKAIGVFCALFDILKAFAAFRIASYLFPMAPAAGVIAGAACVIGHIFPIWIGFRGGKGLACIAGVVLGYSWKLFCVLLLLEIVIALTTNYICAVSISAPILFLACYGVQTGELIGTAALVLICGIMLYKHKDNIARILRDEEVHLSYIWNKEEELERLKDVYPEDYKNVV